MFIGWPARLRDAVSAAPGSTSNYVFAILIFHFVLCYVLNLEDRLVYDIGSLCRSTLPPSIYEVVRQCSASSLVEGLPWTRGWMYSRTRDKDSHMGTD